MLLQDQDTDYDAAFFLRFEKTRCCSRCLCKLNQRYLQARLSKPLCPLLDDLLVRQGQANAADASEDGARLMRGFEMPYSVGRVPYNFRGSSGMRVRDCGTLNSSFTMLKHPPAAIKMYAVISNIHIEKILSDRVR